MKNRLITCIVLILIVISGIIYYKTHVSVRGFYLSKNNLNNAIVYTKDNIYMINNQKLVLDIANEISKMKRVKEINNNFPPGKGPESFRKVLLQTKNHTTYGGSLWYANSNIVQDSNGYYWSVTDSLVKMLETAIKDPSTRRGEN